MTFEEGTTFEYRNDEFEIIKQRQNLKKWIRVRRIRDGSTGLLRKILVETLGTNFITPDSYMNIIGKHYEI